MNSRWKRVFGWTLVAVLLAGGVGLAQDLTADDILDRMEEESDALAQGSMISKMRVDVNHPDGTTTWQTSAVLSKPDRTLIYQLEPEDDEFICCMLVDEEVSPFTQPKKWPEKVKEEFIKRAKFKTRVERDALVVIKK